MTHNNPSTAIAVWVLQAEAQHRNAAEHPAIVVKRGDAAPTVHRCVLLTGTWALEQQDTNIRFAGSMTGVTIALSTEAGDGDVEVIA